MALQYGDTASFEVKMEGPFGGFGSTVKLTSITLYANQWKGGESPFSQNVRMEDVSINSMVNLQPSVEQLEEFRNLEIAFMVENDGGFITVYSIGDKPETDITIQATVTEVVA